MRSKLQYPHSREITQSSYTRRARSRVNNLGNFDLLFLDNDPTDTINIPSEIKNPPKAEIFTMSAELIEIIFNVAINNKPPLM